ncbi:MULTISPECIES: hypothetical protein [unclassified Duganella]|uniref:hypothetical protein n=1 Tax=unclassified Duganella TaxID=2636909 RepID=UPI0012E3D241|nr:MULTISPECIES: hypothetical protein [unclassified Duganella]
MRRLICLLLSMFAIQAQASNCALDGIKLLALGAEDGRIVLQMPDRALQEVAVGDVVPGTEARLTKLLQSAAVFELPGAQGGEGQTVRLLKSGAVQCFKVSDEKKTLRRAPMKMDVFQVGEPAKGASQSGKKQD